MIRRPVTPLSEVTAHQSAVDDLTTLARADLAAFWRSLDGATPDERAVAVRRYLPVLVTAYGTATGSLGADFYDELRAAAPVAVGFAAVVDTDITEGDLQSVIGWGLAPVFAPEGPVLDDALARLTRGAARLVADADRATIITNTRNDPDAVRYVRHASANACAFCAMLATRQAVYRSEASASVVVGRGTAKRNDGSGFDRLRKGVRARGTQDLGEKYHDHCHCVAVPVWPGQEVEEAPYVADWREAYFAATDELGGASDTKAILARMRESLGTH